MSELQYNRIWNRVFGRAGNPPEEFPKAVDAMLADMEAGKIRIGATANVNTTLHLTRFREYFSNSNTLEKVSKTLGVSKDVIRFSIVQIEGQLMRHMKEYL